MRWIIALQLIVLTIAALAAGLIHAHYSPDRAEIEKMIPRWYARSGNAAQVRNDAKYGKPVVIVTPAANAANPDDAETVKADPTAAVTLEAIAGKEDITTDEARFLWEEQAADFIDARAYDLYKEGHIAGAWAIPYDVLRENGGLPHFEGGIIVPGETRLVVYCKGGNCDESDLVAKELRSIGFTCHVYVDGYPAWLEAGYEVDEGPDLYLVSENAEPSHDHNNDDQ